MPKIIIFSSFFSPVVTQTKKSANFLMLKDFVVFSNLEPVALVALTRLSHTKLLQLAAVAACWNDEPVGGNPWLKLK